MNPKHISKLYLWFGVILIIFIFGVSGFMLIEGLRFLDALYMTVITITTIGYTEVKPLSAAGRIFNICFIIELFLTIQFYLIPQNINKVFHLSILSQGFFANSFQPPELHNFI